MGIVGMDESAVLVQRRAARGEARRPVRRIRAQARSPRRAERALYVVPDVARPQPRAPRPAALPTQATARAVSVAPRPGVGAEVAPVRRVRSATQLADRGSVVRPRAVRVAPAQQLRSDDRYVPVRLTRRGKFVARSVLILVAVIVVVGIAASTRASVDAPPSGPYPVVVVESGDTLWSIAEHYAPGIDQREAVAEIRRMNHLESNVVEVGQQLVLPLR
jgi:LysM repeat protein